MEAGNEFKTIFNELDEGVMILKGSKMVQINNEFKKSILFKYFDEDTTAHISQYTDLYETLQLDTKRKEIEHKKGALLRGLQFICCWRENKKYQHDLSDSQMDFYAKIEEKVLMSKIFKQYKMKGQGT